MTTQTAARPVVRAPLRPETTRPGLALRVSRRALQVGISLAALTFLLVVVLPRVTGASWDAALHAIASVSPWQLAALTVLWLVGLWSYAYVMSASLPGLTKGQGFVLNLVGSGVSNLVPFGGAVGVGATWAMARQYGFSHRSIGLFTAVTGVWNVVARLALPVFGLAGLLAVGAHVSGSVLVAASVGAGLCVLVIGLIAAALASDRAAARVARGVGSASSWAARLVRRPAPQGLEQELLDLRENARRLLRASRGGLVVGMTGYLILQGLLMWACLAAVGSDLGPAEVAAGYALGRMLTVVVLTPGGTGFAETGAAAVLVALGGDPVVTRAGVLLFSFFTYFCELPGAVLAYGWHLRARHWRRPA